jgi:methionine synthase II (cobalamin-independent)
MSATASIVPTVVGSFPHAEPRKRVDVILSALPDLPAWPQLPARDWREGMYVQYTEGLPGAVIDDQAQRLHFTTDGDFAERLEGFYAAVIGGDVERFAISPEFAAGLHAFLDAVAGLGGARPGRLKGQVTGPFSFAMTVTDAGNRALAYTPELFEVATSGMAMKARWMARRLRELAADVLIVLDEPYLCSFGSAFVNVSREDVLTAIAGAVSAIHAEGARAGLHCCGNTDWSLVLATGVEVVNFDAYEYFQGLSLYPADLAAFLERDGVLSWGLIPTNKSPDGLRAQDLVSLLDAHVEHLAAKGLDPERLRGQALLTPSCGMGTLSVGEAERVLALLGEVTALLRRRGGAA